jgi:hypothetical protein
VLLDSFVHSCTFLSPGGEAENPTYRSCKRTEVDEEFAMVGLVIIILVSSIQVCFCTISHASFSVDLIGALSDVLFPLGFYGIRISKKTKAA